MAKAIDLHIHSTASDGSLTPAQVVERANSLGLVAIAITDHDSVAGQAEALEHASSQGVVVIPGIEISCEEDAEEVHILGYYIDFQASWFQGVLNGLQQKREIRMLNILKKLHKLGVFLKENEIRAVAGEGSLGRPHVAQVMAAKGYVSSVAEAFHRYLGSGAPAYVPRRHISPEEAINIVKQAGGIAVLAHPGVIKDQSRLPGIIKLGLEGIECWHSDHGPGASHRYLEIAKEYGLVSTGGSDYHGAYFSPQREMGKPRVGEEVYVGLLRYKETKEVDQFCSF